MDDKEYIEQRQEFLQNEHLWHGQQLLPNRGKGEFFAEFAEKRQAAQAASDGRRRLDVAQVMEASDDVLLKQNGEGTFLQQKVVDGQTSYNLDEYHIGKETTEAQIGLDMREGKVSKYVLKIMSDPKSLPYWEQ